MGNAVWLALTLAGSVAPRAAAEEPAGGGGGHTAFPKPTSA